MAAKKTSRRKKAVEPEAVPSADASVALEAQAQPAPESETIDAPVATVAEVASVSAPAVSEAGHEVALASNCMVKDAAALKQSLLALKDLPQSVVIDAGSVERVDTATLQLLCAFVRERMGHDREITWRSPSVALLDASRLLGVTELLCLPAEAA